MDEPTSALAVAEVEAVLRLIRRLAERGVAIVLITHRLQDLFRVCDRIAVMYEGMKVAERRIGETDLEDLVGPDRRREGQIPAEVRRERRCPRPLRQRRPQGRPRPTSSRRRRRC